MEEKKYGVVVEWKQEAPLIMESQLLTYEKALDRMRFMAADPRVIRVAVFEAIFRDGNETILPKQESN